MARVWLPRLEKAAQKNPLKLSVEELDRRLQEAKDKRFNRGFTEPRYAILVLGEEATEEIVE